MDLHGFTLGGYFQGKPQLIANINACQAVADTVRTTLGPAGRDKLIATNRVTIR